MMNLLIKHAAELITCSGYKAKQGEEMTRLGIIPDGALVIENGLISKVGKTEEVLSHLNLSSFEVLDAAGKAVLPGFVDPHTHFVFGGFRAEEFFWRLRGESYLKILEQGGGINNTVRATRQATWEELLENGRKRLDTFLSFGVTTVEGKSGYGLDHDTEIKQLEIMTELDSRHPVDIVRTFLGAHTVPLEYKGNPDGFIDYLISQVLPDVVSLKLAEFCDVFCEKGVFSVDQSRRLLEAAGAMGLKAKLHADEITPLGGAELAAQLGAVSADHLLYASDQGIEAMARAGVVATLLPGTAFSLKEPYARARYMIDQGCAVALATDFNPGSCFSESISLMMALAALYMGMTPEEVVTAFTINAAAAIGRADIIGSLDVGKAGDVVVLEFPSYLYLPYHLGVNSVEKVIKRGKVVFDKNK
ncbi:MAG: imidazolonepropionase [Desulfobacca sp.]|nr:imidazolonepropionase [Desulfobacca sp.]